MASQRLGQIAQGIGIVIGGNDLLVGGCTGDADGVRVQHDHLAAETVGRHHEVAAELAATEHTQSGGGSIMPALQGERQHPVALLGAEAVELLVITGSVAILGDRQQGHGEQTGIGGTRPPMAKVATGTPLGICTMESRNPSPELAGGDGHAQHRDRGLAASMPGR